MNVAYGHWGQAPRIRVSRVEGHVQRTWVPETQQWQATILPSVPLPPPVQPRGQAALVLGAAGLGLLASLFIPVALLILVLRD